jgi:hypothetical protein
MRAYCMKCRHNWLPRQEGIPKKCPRCQSQTAVRQQPSSAPAAASQESIYEHLLRLRGLLHETYKELGGAEKFIRELREGYDR